MSLFLKEKKTLQAYQMVLDFGRASIMRRGMDMDTASSGGRGKVWIRGWRKETTLKGSTREGKRPEVQEAALNTTSLKYRRLH